MSLANHPLNLAFRFLLELAALASVGWWGWNAAPRVWGAVLATFLVGATATAWAVFRVPNDGGKPVVAVSGRVRLALEAAVFGGAVSALALSGKPNLAAWLAGAVVLHNLLSWYRLRRLLANSSL